MLPIIFIFYLFSKISEQDDDFEENTTSLTPKNLLVINFMIKIILVFFLDIHTLYFRELNSFKLLRI